MNARIKLSARAALTGSQGRVVPTAAVMITLFLIFTFCNGILDFYSVNETIIFAVSAGALILSVISASALRLSLQKKLLMLASNV